MLSATAFGLSGTLGKSLIDAGWSPGAAVTARFGLGGLVLLGPALWAVRADFSVLRKRPVLGAMAAYGLLAIVVSELCYFNAIKTLPVAVALLIQFTAPVAVVVWMWLRHQQRPTWLTVAGAVLAAGGLALVLQVFSGVSLNLVGVAWASGAMIGAASYFILGAHAVPGLPGITLAGGSLIAATAGLALAGAIGILPMHAATRDVLLANQPTPWWVPVVLLAVVAAALSYTAGIAAARRLGARMASFVALWEVIAAVIFAWLLIGEVPAAIQLVGGVLILAGVATVKLGERDL